MGLEDRLPLVATALARETSRSIFLALYTDIPTPMAEISRTTGIKIYGIARDARPLLHADLVKNFRRWEVPDDGSATRSYYGLTQRGKIAREYFNSSPTNNLLKLLQSVEGLEAYEAGSRVRWEIIRKLRAHPEGLSVEQLLTKLKFFVRNQPTLSYYMSELRDMVRTETNGKFIEYFPNLSPSELDALEKLEKISE